MIEDLSKQPLGLLGMRQKHPASVSVELGQGILRGVCFGGRQRMVLAMSGALVRFLSLAALVFLLPVAVLAQYTYTTSNGTAIVSGYTGTGGALEIPGTIDELPVAGIGGAAGGHLAPARRPGGRGAGRAPQQWGQPDRYARR